MGNYFGVQHNPILNESPFISLTYPLWYTTPVADHRRPSWTCPRTDPPQHTKLEILWLGLNINLRHSRATADSQAHRTVFCGKFGTHFAKYFKPFYNCRSAGLWWPIFSSIQINLTEFHQGKVILEISLFLHLCVAVLSVPVGCHWLWGIASLYSDMLRYSSLKWVWFQVSLNPWQTRLILTGWLAQMGTSSATATQQSAGCCSDSAQAQPWYIFGWVH